MSTPLQDSAMLVSLNISQWTARKHDRSVSNEVDKTHGAKDAGRYNKLLIRKEALEPMEQIAGAARAYLYKVTLAWGDNGERLLPAALFMDFAQELSQFRNEFDNRVRAFVAEYPTLVQEARVRLGTLYDPQDYPADIRDKFCFRPPSITPIPSANDFRVNLSSEYVDQIKAEMTQRERCRQDGTVKQLWVRMREHVGKIADRLGNEKSALFDSLMSNPRELIDILPALNLTNNIELNNAADDLKALLVPIDRLRQDKRLRADTARLAEGLLARMPA
jgi:hypothetical protein